MRRRCDGQEGGDGGGLHREETRRRRAPLGLGKFFLERYHAGGFGPGGAGRGPSMLFFLLCQLS
jgi:hypothetical protein